MNPTAIALSIGIILGMILFFVCMGTGLLDKLLASMENWFSWFSR